MVPARVRCVRVISVFPIIFSRVTNFQGTLTKSIPGSRFVTLHRLTVRNRGEEPQIPLNAVFQFYAVKD